MVVIIGKENNSREAIQKHNERRYKTKVINNNFPVQNERYKPPKEAKDTGNIPKGHQRDKYKSLQKI